MWMNAINHQTIWYNSVFEIIIFSWFIAMDSKAQKTQVEKINMEQNQHPLNQSDEESLKAECSKKLATNGVFFQCPMIDCKCF